MEFMLLICIQPLFNKLMQLRLLATLVFYFFSIHSLSAQYFTAPATTGTGTPVNVINSSGITDFSNNNFYFNADTFSIATNPLVNLNIYTFPNNLLQTPTFSDLAYDGTNYYLFSSNYFGGVIRWDFGPNIFSTPTAVNLGNLGNTQNEGIIIRRQNNNWYGFLVSNGPTTKLTRIDFGTNLANPTPATTSLGTLTLSWPHELEIIDDGGNWYGFVANRNTRVTRLDFGNSLTNTPTPFVYNNTNIASPCNLRVVKDKGNWHLFSVNLFNGHIVRTDIGPNLANNTPTYTNLGEPNPAVGIARGFTLLQDCNGLRGFLTDESSNIFDLRFDGDSLTGALSGTIYNGISWSTQEINDFTPFWSNDTLYFFATNPYSWVGLCQINPTLGPNNQSSSAFSPSFTYSNSGNPTITNLINIGQSGMRHQCQQITVSGITNVSVTRCPGDTIILSNNTIVSAPGVYMDTFLNVLNQDSIVAISFSNYPTYNNTVQVSLCQGQSYMLPSNVVVNTTGVYQDTLSTINGCDSIIVTSIQVSPTYSAIVYDTICDNSFYILPGGLGVNTTGTYVDTLSTSAGCDSIITTNLYVYPTYQINIADTICAGSPYTLPNGTIVNSGGTYTNSFTAQSGCDSVYVINLYAIPATVLYDTAILCDQSTYLLPNGNTVSTSGTFLSNFISSRGCDSIISTTVYFNTSQMSTQNVTICSNSTYTLPDNQIVSSAGTYTSTITASNGCDSIITTIITTVNAPTINLGPDMNICNSTITLDATAPNATYLWNDNVTTATRTINEEGLYIVQVSVSPCPLVSDTILLTGCKCAVFIPNAFSPNNDSKNDLFSPIINCKIFDGSYLFQIYNRWGQCVFYTTLESDGWDGTFRGQPQNIGTYYYMVQFVNERTNEAELYKGDITLIK